MMYAIDVRGNPSVEIKALLMRLLSDIDSNCAYSENGIETALHTVRRTIKKIRAVLVLIRDELGYSSYLREKNFYGDISRKLSEVRSLDVFLKLAGEIDQLFRQDWGYSCLLALIKKIRTMKERNIALPGNKMEFSDYLIRQIAKARLNTEYLQFREDSFHTVLNGLKASYKKCLHTLRACRDNNSYSNLHELRKAMKILGYQLRVLKAVNPVIYKAYARAIESDCDVLGRINDYAEFKLFYSKSVARGLNRENRRILEQITDHLIDEKLSIALPQAQLALIEKPSDFVHRISGYYNVMVEALETKTAD